MQIDGMMGHETYEDFLNVIAQRVATNKEKIDILRENKELIL